MKTMTSGLVLCVLATSTAAAAKVQIVSPVKNEQCELTIQVDAKAEGDEGNWPVVFVKPQDFNFPYYAQEQVSAVDDDGSFSATAQLGEFSTVAGTKFTVIVVLVASKDEADKYAQGKTVETLPKSVASARVVVSRK